MKRAILAGMFAVGLGLTAACGGGNDEAAIAERDPEVSGRGENSPVPVTVTGCLTASDDRFVLTDLVRGAAGADARPQQGGDPSESPQPTTESYQLIGNDDELRGLVGRQVRVTGEADAPKVAEIREMTPPTQPGAAGTSGTAAPAKPGEPQVATTTETRLEVTQLRVQTVTATGEACATAGREQPR